MKNFLILTLLFLGACNEPSTPIGPTPSPSATPGVSVTPSATPTASPTPGSTPSATPDSGPGTGSSDDGDTIIASGKVDLRGRDAPIKDQIGPLCTAYAGVGGIQNLLGKTAPDFSEEYVFSIYDEYSVDAFYEQVPGEELALNVMWPRGGKKKSPFSLTNHKLVLMKYLGDGVNEKAKQALRAKHPVYLGLEVPADMASCLASIRPTSKVTSGGHAVLIVGYVDDNSNSALGGGYFIIRNSWSVACGDKGYQYLPYSYFNKSYGYMYEMLTAQ